MPENSYYDIVCIGFGPAALSIAIALQERRMLEKQKVLFLERQAEFGWHVGMLLPGTKMQISFLKDLATMRNPQSHFTFINYLHTKGRLSSFINLSTHTPFRDEFNDYLKWCASYFHDHVEYNQEVIKVSPMLSNSTSSSSMIEYFRVTSRTVESGMMKQVLTRNVIVCNGGECFVPHALRGIEFEDYVLHSSRYLRQISQNLPNEKGRYRIAVVGSGQSAVEICEDVQSRYPNSHVSLLFRDSALRPSDDSPFVNEIFDHSVVDQFYSLEDNARKKILLKNKSTNYGVVRLPLLERMYEQIYRQQYIKCDPQEPQLSLHNNIEICNIRKAQSGDGVKLQFKNTMTGDIQSSDQIYNVIILATGYIREPFSNILRDLKPLLLSSSEDSATCVQRNYRLRFHPGLVAQKAGVWMQGSCETTHGISDTLLSILALRATELIDSIECNQKFPDLKFKL